MGFKMISRSSLPVSTRGQASTEPKVAVRENGQIAFNKLAATEMGTPVTLVIMFDEDKRHLVFKPYVSGKSALPKGVKKEDYEKELFSISYGNKTKIESPYFAAANLLKDLEYDYIKSGNQTFTPLVKDGALVITLPKGALEAKPKAERKKKDPATSNGPVKNVPVERNASKKEFEEAKEETSELEDFDLSS